jgi:UDP-N-acetylmuramoyl-L-alanyl-D-glutamate--2,6-diaminopimelate ligase
VVENKESAFIAMPAVFRVTCHTDHVGVGSTFVVINGMREDGAVYIPKALAQGATTIVIEHTTQLSPEILQLIEQSKALLQSVDDTRVALAHLSAQAYGFPARSLKIVGVTGTKGKSSTVFMLEHLLRKSGHTTALLSTVRNSINGVFFKATLTTPQPDYVHAFLYECVKHKVEYVVMEVAAQAMTLHRTEGIVFDGVIFTNFDREHGEFYNTMDEYFAAKARLFEQVKPGAPRLVNVDDPWGQKLFVLYPQSLTFGVHEKNVTYRARPIDVTLHLVCEVIHNGQAVVVRCPALFGMFNVYNVLAAVSLAHELGVSLAQAALSLKDFAGTPGRLERYILPNGAYGVIDYAHNPSSYNAVLSSLRAITDHLIVVFGAGGDRDATKRPIMGAIVAQFADFIVVTSDNPRTENAADIARDICAGIPREATAKMVCELDRAIAIQKAYAHSHKGSIIAILGKGPDEYQIIGTTKYPFSEKQILQGL